jgi:hypothetical protein
MIKEKKLCLKFLGTTKSGAMANATTKIKVKILHLKSKNPKLPSVNDLTMKIKH